MAPKMRYPVLLEALVIDSPEYRIGFRYALEQVDGDRNTFREWSGAAGVVVFIATHNLVPIAAADFSAMRRAHAHGDVNDGLA